MFRHDPNEKKNRIPTELELEGLRALALSQSHIANFLDGEVEKLQSSYKALADRLLQQQRELEATQSQLCATKKLTDSLRNQRSAVKMQMDELRGLMHPVRRLPVELLRAIFEAAMDIAESKLKMAVKLSHVCRQWRDIALDAPRLWSQVSLRPSANSNSFWAEIIPRMKTIPATVHIEGIKERHIPLLETWRLSTIPNIEKLTLGSSHALTAYSIYESLFSLPYMPLKELTIVMEGDVDVLGEEELFQNVQMGHFPSLLKLAIKGIGFVSFGPAPSPTITTLILDGVDGLDMQQVLQFRQLETLKLIRVIFCEPISLEGLVSPTIRFLQLGASPLFHEPWAAALKFPELHSLYTDDHPNDLFVAFVMSHPTIKELDCVINEGQLAVYAAALPALTSLYIAPPFDEFVDWMEAGMSSAPFPSLKVLILADETTLEEFEEVVCARCLPSDHPRSLIEPPILPVEELRIVLESTAWEDAPWAEHELAQSASIELIPYILEDDLYCAVLCWRSSTGKLTPFLFGLPKLRYRSGCTHFSSICARRCTTFA